MPRWIVSRRVASALASLPARITPASTTRGPPTPGSTTAYPVTLRPGSIPRTRPETGTNGHSEASSRVIVDIDAGPPWKECYYKLRPAADRDGRGKVPPP